MSWEGGAATNQLIMGKRPVDVVDLTGTDVVIDLTSDSNECVGHTEPLRRVKGKIKVPCTQGGTCIDQTTLGMQSQTRMIGCLTEEEQNLKDLLADVLMEEWMEEQLKEKENCSSRLSCRRDIK